MKQNTAIVSVTQLPDYAQILPDFQQITQFILFGANLAHFGPKYDTFVLKEINVGVKKKIFWLLLINLNIIEHFHLSFFFQLK